MDGLICCSIYQWVLSPLDRRGVCECYARHRGRLYVFLSAINAMSCGPLPSKSMDEIQ